MGGETENLVKLCKGPALTELSFSEGSRHQTITGAALPGGSVVKNSARAGDADSVPVPGKSHMPRSN